MRIGIVLPTIPAYSETFFNNKIRGLESCGYEVTLFVNNSKLDNSNFKSIQAAPDFSRNTIKTIFLGLFCFFKLLLFHYPVFKRFYKLEKTDSISVLQVIKRGVSSYHILTNKLDWLHFGFGTMAIGKENVAAAIGAKMAVSFRGFDHYVYPLKNKDCYRLLFSKKVKYHVLSDGMKNDLINQNIDEEYIVKITPAIDSQFFSMKWQEFKTIHFISVARLHWVKGLDYTLEALSVLDKSGIDFHYSIIGEGIEKERLVFLSHQLGLEKKVTFCGKLNQNQIKKMLDEAMYYIQYSLQEGFCNAVLEAQAMGKICIVSNADGLVENVINEETGFVVKKRDSKALAEKITKVLNLPIDKKQEVAKNANQRVVNTFSLEKQIAEFVEFYNN